jgi:pimeloyl-ACP methyl ester carboxylesterase
VPTLALYGPDDHVLAPTFPDRCRVAFPNCIGPFVLQRCGHFVQWEAADVLNNALRWFCADLLDEHAHRADSSA